MIHTALKPGPEEDGVIAVNKRENRSLYARRIKIYPRDVAGRFRRAKWLAMVVLLVVYYVTPWLRWDRGANAPDQTVLVDLPARKFYFFFVEIWPQEIYYITGILVLMALGLFVLTATFGRVWCGFACPQTVWTDLFMKVERLIEGDRNARLRLDAAPWSGSKLGKRALKHAVWILIGMVTGGAWIFYFADAPTLAADLVRFQAPAAAYITMGFLTMTTYVLAGFAREQVCTYMCPYARFQAAMLDEHSLIVTYRSDRGEPRGKHKKGESWEGRGDCIDCFSCVAVCPTGIDIRDGQQIECINCGLCADACDAVMDKVERPRGLIGLDSLAMVNARKAGKPAAVRLVRLRTVLYLALMGAIAGIMLYALLTRSEVELTVLRDRNPLFVLLTDGSIRNGYTIRVLNKRHEERHYLLSVEGIPGLSVSALGRSNDAAGRPELPVPPDSAGTFRIFIEVPPGAAPHGARDLRFRLQDVESGARTGHDSSFRGPG